MVTKKELNKIKGWTFYAEFESSKEKRKWTRAKLNLHKGFIRCIAVNEGTKREQISYNGCVEVASSVYFYDNSECACSTASLEYLPDNCLKISKELAFKLHPNLYKYLKD